MALIKSLIPCLALVIILSVFGLSQALEFRIGGSKKAKWEVPSSSDDFNKWSQKLRFQIGDSIVFKYDGKKDSVLQVSEESYNTCNTSNPIKSYNDDKTKITLDRSGPFYFISGADGHCQKGQKVEISVLSANHHIHNSTAPSPADSPLAPAPAPAKKNGCSGLKAGFLGAFVAVVGVLALV